MLIGHKSQLLYLAQLAAAERVPHALLFSGPEHIGKQLMARMFFWRLVDSASSWRPFFSTRNTLARAICSNTHPDFLHIEKEAGKTKISIEQVRLLKKFVGLTRQELSYKGIIIDDAHLLSHEAYNSLLKTFEEPQGNVIIILVTNQHKLLPETIRSRAFEIRFQRVADTIIKKGVSECSTVLTDDDFGWVAGRPGLAFRYCREESDDYASLLREQYYSFVSSTVDNSIQDSFKNAESIAQSNNTLVSLEAWILAAYTRARNSGVEDRGLLYAQTLVALRKKLAETNVNQRLHIEQTLLQLI